MVFHMLGWLIIRAEVRPGFLRRDPAPAVEPLLDAIDAAEVPVGPSADVALLTVPMDHDATLIRAVRDLDFSDVDVEGMSGGQVNGTAAIALGEVADSMPVVFSSRPLTGAETPHSGPSSMHTRSAPGRMVMRAPTVRPKLSPSSSTL